jgi:hypothetical protein
MKIPDPAAWQGRWNSWAEKRFLRSYLELQFHLLQEIAIAYNKVVYLLERRNRDARVKQYVAPCTEIKRDYGFRMIG